MTSPCPPKTLRQTPAARLLAAMATLALASSPVFAAQQTWSGTNSGVWDTSVLNWDSGTAAWTGSNDALFTGTPTTNVTTATGLTIGAITLDNTFTGSVTMSGANTVNGATTISGGTLNLNFNTGLGNSAITVNSGGTLAINPGTGNNTVSNNISGAGLITAQDPAGAAGNTLQLGGNYSGFTGTLNILAGASNNGKVNFSNTAQGNVMSSSATIQVQSGATLYLNKALNYGASLELFGAGNAENLGALRLETSANQTGSVTLKGNSFIGVSGTTDATISGAIGENGGSFGFTKVGTRVLTLSGTNNYTGVTTVSAGTLLFSKTASFYNNTPASWTATNLVVNSGATAAFSVGGTGEFTTSDIANLATLGTASGGFKSGSAIGIDTTNASGGVLTYSSAITNPNGGANALGVAKFGTGTLELSGANTNTGTTTVNAGTLKYTGSGTNFGQLVVNGIGAKSVVNFASGAGTYTYNNASMLVGNNAAGAGAVYQSAGTISGVNQLQIGAVTGGAYGYYNLSGGSLSIAELDLGGFNGAPNGVMDISGGTLNASSWLIVARGSGGTGLLNMTGGTVNYTGTTANRFIMNYNANGGESAIINVANANFTATNATGGVLDLMKAGAAGQRGIVNLLSGGVMQVHGLKASNTTGTSNLNFNGGTLKASTANTAFLTGLTAAAVYSGGGTIDNNGVNITVGQALTEATGTGVTSIAVTNGGSGYIGAPIVSFSGGTGTNATGYAVMVDDGTGNGTYKVGSIVITSPGTYSANPTTVTLTGGGASTAASGFSISTGSNTSGGMTFSGSGTTTLSAANTYTGLTTISAGTLALGASGTIANSSGVNLGTAGSPGTLDLTAKNAFNFGEGQTVSGYGTINIGAGKTVTIEGSFAPGNSPGMVTVTGDLTLAGTSTTTMEIESLSSMDLVTVSGTLTYGGDLVIEGYNGYSLSSVGSVGTYSLFDLSSTTAWAGSFSSVTLTGIGGLTSNSSGFSGTYGGLDYTFVYSSGDLTIAASAIPEPSTYAGLAGLVALGVVAYRRRRRA